MKVVVNGVHYKNVDKKYSKVANMSDYFDDLEHRRLSDSEKEQLDVILLNQIYSEHFTDFMDGLQAQVPHVYRVIHNQSLVKTVHVITQNHSYYVACFANKIEVRCPASLYKKSPVKKTIRRLY